MAYTTINKHTDYFNTKLYTGTGSSNAITGVGHQPDFTWIKQRNETRNSSLYDSVRGVQIRIQSSSSDGNSTLSNGLTAFGTDGFTVVSHDDVNKNSGTYASWNWKAGTTGSGTTGGSGSAQSYSYSVNTTAGFSIVKYTGNATAGHTIPHHLGAVPKFIIVKRLDGTSGWHTYHASLGNTQRMSLNETDATSSDSTAWNDTTPTSTVFTVGNSGTTNVNDADTIAYCFAEKTGFSKFGSYIGNGNNDGSFIYLGFKPAFFLIKRTDSSESWIMTDNKRGTNNDWNYVLADSNAAEVDGDLPYEFLSNGIKMRGTTQNGDGNTFVYMAFAEAPLVGSNNIPVNAR